MFRVTMSFAGRPVKKYTFDQDQVTVGRDPACEVVVENIGASRRHAVIERTPQGYALRDLGSHNGTYVGGDRVERHPLADGDEFLIGKYSFHFEELAPAAVPLAAAHTAANDRTGPLSQPLGPPKTAPVTVPVTVAVTAPVTEAIPQGLHAAAAAAAAAHPAGHPSPAPATAAAAVAAASSLNQDMTFRLDRADIERIVGLAQKSSSPKLVQLHPAEHKRNVSLERPYYVLGAAENVDIRVSGFFAPPRAALLLRTEHGWRALGFGKLKVNGQKAGDVSLSDGDLVEVAGSRFRFCHA